MLCVLLAKKYCKVQSALYYYFENTEGIIRSEISNAKIRDAKIIMDHIRQAIQSRKAELGNVIEQCYCEIQTFLLWHQYIEPYSRIETFMNRELDICKEEFLKSEPDIFNNPYVKFFSDDVVLKRMSRLRVTAKKMNNVCFLDNAIHICLGIHDKDGNYSVWAGTTMQSIVENTKAPIVFHILHDDTLNEINKNKLSFIADNSGNDIEFHHFNSDVFGTFADSMCHHVIYEKLLALLCFQQWIASLFQPRHCNFHPYHVYQDRYVLHYLKSIHYSFFSQLLSALTFFSIPHHLKKTSHMDY